MTKRDGHAVTEGPAIMRYVEAQDHVYILCNPGSLFWGSSVRSQREAHASCIILHRVKGV